MENEEEQIIARNEPRREENQLDRIEQMLATLSTRVQVLETREQNPPRVEQNLLQNILREQQIRGNLRAQWARDEDIQQYLEDEVYEDEEEIPRFQQGRGRGREVALPRRAYRHERLEERQTSGIKHKIPPFEGKSDPEAIQ